MLILRYLLTLIILTMIFPALGQSLYSSNFKHTIDSIFQLNRQGKVNDTSYLNLVNLVAQKAYGEAGFEKQLLFYRELAFKKNTHRGKYRIAYYRHLSLNSLTTDQIGRATYFFDKEIAEARKMSSDRSHDIAMALHMLSMYRNTRAYDECIKEYVNILPELRAVPGKINQGTISKASVNHALSLLAYVMPVYGNRGDTIAVNGVYELTGAICHACQKKQGIYKAYLPEYLHKYYRAQYWYHLYNYPDNYKLAEKDLLKTRNLLLSKEYASMPRRHSLNELSELYADAAEFHLNYGSADSVRYYIALQQKLDLDAAAKAGSRMDYYKLLSRLAAKDHNYTEAYHQLKKVCDIKDSTLQNVIADRNNNLYAQAEAEDKQLKLSEANKQQELVSKQNRLLIMGSCLLFLMTILIYVFLRHRQRQKYVEFKLNMARNLHDQTGPALLYAKALVNQQSKDSNNGNYAELERHIGHTMETIRSLAHDLKSREQYTTALLVKEIEIILKKLSGMAGFDYVVKQGGGNRRLISHFQYVQLKAVLHECISNSVKHAEFDKITITFNQRNSRMLITYNDNGIGPEPEQLGEGIGMDNIKERVEKLGGHFKLDNHFPNGYSFSFDIPLL